MLNEQLAQRLGDLRSWQEDFETELRHSMSEALQTCSRLADDSLAASEATQRKLDDLRLRTEAALQGQRTRSPSEPPLSDRPPSSRPALTSPPPHQPQRYNDWLMSWAVRSGGWAVP